VGEGLLEQGLLRILLMVGEVVVQAVTPVAAVLRLVERLVEDVVCVFFSGARTHAELSLEGAQGELVDMEAASDAKDAAADGAEQGFDVEVRGRWEGDEQER